jgi:lysophospholipase L1-like esterase
MAKNFLTLCGGLLVSILIAEIVLHLFNPFPTRVKGNRIILPVNRKYSFINDTIRSLDKRIEHTKNSIGFRGPEFPSNAADTIKIFCVGGSTTECFYLSDGYDWPTLLGVKLQEVNPHVWVNNAGLDGHSTFGHELLLQDYLIDLEPDYIIFLVGANDMGRSDLNDADVWSIRGRYTSVRNILWEHSELVNIYMQIARYFQAKKKKIVHGSHGVLNAPLLDLDDTFIQTELARHTDLFLPSFKKRVQALIDICQRHSIMPVFLTQPVLYGDAIDPVTNTDLAKVKLSKNMNGYLLWREMELYNDVVRRVCDKNRVPYIDTAKEMPHSSRYYYDTYHFNNKGAEKLAEIVYKGVTEKQLLTLPKEKDI